MAEDFKEVGTRRGTVHVSFIRREVLKLANFIMTLAINIACYTTTNFLKFIFNFEIILDLQQSSKDPTELPCVLSRFL